MIKLIIIILIGIVYVSQLQPQAKQPQALLTEASKAATADAANLIAESFARQLSNVQVHGQGTVSKILKDDTDGNRHQRFILRLAPGLTVLVAHNTELAPHIDDLQVGDTIEFYGEYEWNAKGGVLHWTHHDPHHTHIDGWLKHHGHTYQ